MGLSRSTSGYAWCATFVSWVAKQTGATSYRSTWVVDWVDQARAGRYHLSVTTSPQPGDIVAFDWDGGNDYRGGNEHIGFVRTVSGSSFTTVEGNTGNPDNGGANDGVYSKTRSTNSSYDVLFIRVR
ncbi:CHAP domain-containing protein [Streptomyces sp. L7]